MTTDRALPGFSAALLRIDLRSTEAGYLQLRVWSADDERYLARVDSDLYADLTAGEVLDVIDAVVEDWRASL